MNLKQLGSAPAAARRIMGLILLGVVLVGAGRAGLLAPLYVVADYTIKPIGSVFSTAGRKTAEFSGLVGGLRELATDNARLEAEVRELRLHLSRTAELRAENAALRRELNFTEDSPLRLTAARVVAYQPDNFRQFLTLNRGQRDGIEIGMAVISEGSLVGRVSSVELGSAKVFLLSDPDFRVAVTAQEGRASGIVKGQIGGGLLLDRVAQGETLTPGDTIVTSGLGGEFPRGLAVGRVESVESPPGAVFQTARVASLIRISRLEVVSVVTGR